MAERIGPGLLFAQAEALLPVDSETARRMWEEARKASAADDMSERQNWPSLWLMVCSSARTAGGRRLQGKAYTGG